MTRDLEFEGNNIEKTVEIACEELKIPREKLKYDVISYGSSGIFGLVGTKKARIRVIISESTEDVSGKASDKEKSNAPKEEEKVSISSSNQITADSPGLQTFPENPRELGQQVLQRIVDVITTGAKISVEEKPERICYKVDGGNAAILIGKRGQTLEAIQYIVEKIINKRNEQRVRIQVDIEGYLEMRRDSLRRLAERLSEKAKRTGKPVTIGQMNAHDRRIVHLALKDDEGVRTKSIGDGFLRKLVIFPGKNTFQRYDSQ